MRRYMSCTLRTENIFEIRLYYTSQKPLDRPSRVFILNEMRFHHRSREFLSSLSLPFPFIYLISLLLASLMRYTIVFYIKSFLPCGLSPATRSLTGQLPSPPFVPFFFPRNDESLICDSTNFGNAAAKKSLLLEVVGSQKTIFSIEMFSR